MYRCASNRRNNSRAYGLLLGALLAAVLAACTGPTANSATSREAPPAARAASAEAPAGTVQSSMPGAPARPLRNVKVGVLAPNQSHAGIYIALERGYFREQGLDVELIPFTRGLEMVPPLSTNQIQVGTGSAGAGMFNAISQGIYNPVVADSGSAQPGTGGMALTYRRDLYDSGALVRPEQLRGKSIAISGPDAVQEAWILGYLVPHVGLAATDVNLVTIALPDVVAAFSNRTVDSALAIEPFVSTIVSRDLGTRGLTAGDITPGLQLATILYAEGFTQDRDAANAWMVGYVRALRDYNDAILRKRHRDEVLGILERYRAIPSDADVDHMTLFAFNPNGYVYQDSLVAMQDYFARKGSVKQPVPMSALVDNLFVDHAVRVLGEYR